MINGWPTKSGILLRGDRVVIPPCMRKQVLLLIHKSHLGIVRMKKLARMHVWWPGIDAELELTCNTCASCMALGSNPPAKLSSWPTPETQWERIHVDYANYWGTRWLVVVAALSKWPIVLAKNTAQYVQNLEPAQRSRFRQRAAIQVV